MNAPHDDAPPDLEVGGSWSAKRARWHRQARVEVRGTGDLTTEELSEQPAGPAAPEPRQTYRGAARLWRFKAWLREP